MANICQVCIGTGKLECPICNGYLSSRDNSMNVNLECPTCNNTGQVYCYNCHDVTQPIKDVSPLTPDIISSQKVLLLRLQQIMPQLVPLTQEAKILAEKKDLRSAKEIHDKIICLSKEILRILLIFTQKYGIAITDIRTFVNGLVQHLYIVSDNLQSLGEPLNAKKLRTEVLLFSKMYLSISDFKMKESELTSSLLEEGRFNESLTILKNNMEFFEKENDLIKLAITTKKYVYILTWLGDYERAISELEHVEKIISPIVDGKTFTKSDVDMAIAEAMQDISLGIGNGKKAILISQLYNLFIQINSDKADINDHMERYEEEENCLQKIPSEFSGPAIDYHRAYILIKKGNYNEGLEYANRLEPQFRNIVELRPKLANLLKIQAEALIGLQRFTEALEKLNEAIEDLSGNYYEPHTFWKLLWQRGHTFELLQQKKKALESYSQAISTVNNLRKAPLGYRLDSLYLKDKLELFHAAIDLALQSNLPEQCCEFIEMIKSRTLTTTLSIPREYMTNQNELKNEFDELTRNLDGVQYQIFTKGLSDDLKIKKESIQKRRDEVLERIQFSEPRWRSISEPAPFDLAKISEILNSKKYAAMSLFYIDPKIIVILIKDSKCFVSSKEITPDVKLKLSKYKQNLQNPEQDPRLYDISNGLSINIENLIPVDVLDVALDSQGLIVVPHSFLHLVPWGGLNFKNKRMFEYCPVGILPNLSCIISLSYSVTFVPSIALIGDPDYSKEPYLRPLDGAKEEICKIYEIYPQSNRLTSPPITDLKATKMNFLGLLQRDDANKAILHVACHGNSDTDHPMNSGLILSDAKVDAAEIANSLMRYDEVILSACNTGWRPTQVSGTVLLGDDILGLPAAFLEAGAKSVLVSIPLAADEATSKLMQIYHHNRINGKTPLEALREAQKTILADGKYPVFNWVGFTLYGCQ